MIFISYSHKVKDFVDKLALILVDKRIKVFIDRWEMKLGDSITNKIQDAKHLNIKQILAELVLK